MRTLAFIIMAIASLAVAAYGFVAYTAFPIGSLVHPRMQTVFQEHRLGILLHIFASAITLLLGPWQFLASVRAKWPRVHRWMGRVYLGLGVLPGGIAGLYMSWFAFGGPVAKTGFAILAAAWLFTGLRAYQTARARQFVAHRAWMIRNFALALAAVTLRVQLGTGIASGLTFETVYATVAWASWVPNALVAEWLIRRTRGGATAA